MNSTPRLNNIPFPCDYKIKVMGRATDTFEQVALEIVHQHFPSLKEDSIQQRLSKDHNFISLTVHVWAENLEQLENLYHDFAKSPEILASL